ncbi:hypothetical protein DI487_08780 [Flavobacterium sediminis]|uniref:Methyltransferase domain-containing protein n=1 Tax=Flavobacterium sediminis TaxID=2201181 RepID=A0A2U8QVM9_9FLAO|nr:class I SAM-dependent methyltransferase [Flavobacterium sediminis]AWM13946.1 hypothetical protein DI487_08780 [Flavobacterium sediminis]
MNYLKYIARTGRINQHPQGRLGTHLLLKKIPHTSEAKTILEIGCGTGHTAAILSNNPFIYYEGIDNMLEMIHFCNKRKKKLNLFNCNFKHHTKNSFPYQDNFFDIVICESVLAIQSPEQYKQIVTEAFRVLKDKGLFIFNETIWCPSTSSDTRQKINTISLSYFNIIQADESASLTSWETTLINHGFKIKHIEEIHDLEKTKYKFVINDFELKSLHYSDKMKYRTLFNPKELSLYLYFKIVNRKVKIEKGILESYIITCEKNSLTYEKP